MKDGDAKIDKYLATDRQERQRLEDRLVLRRPGVLQRRLVAARRRRQGRHLWQRRRRSDLPLDARSTATARPLDGSKHNYTLTFADGPIAAGQRLLVGDHV